MFIINLFSLEYELTVAFAYFSMGVVYFFLLIYRSASYK